MEFTAYTLLIDVGWISLLMLIGSELRRRIPLFQTLLLPSPIVAGLFGLLLGPQVLGLLGFSSHMGSYTSLLIAVVFAAMPYSMTFDRGVRQGARTMWAYSTAMFLGQWGFFILLGVFLFAPVWGTEDWFGMMLPVGFVGGFGTAAAVGTSLETIGADAASSLGFTAATVGTLAAIIGGLIATSWGIKRGKTAAVPGKLPWEMRSGYIDKESERPSIGRATTNPSAIDSLGLHVGVLAFTVMLAYLFNQWITGMFPNVAIPLFAVAFVFGGIGMGLLKLANKPRYLDKETMKSVSGASTDYLIAFGIASIVPQALADYLVPLIVLFVLGIVYCAALMIFVAPVFFGENWLERGVFSWGWGTAAVATGIALLKIVDPKLKSGTLNEYGVAYIGFAPFEIGMTIIAPIAVIAGWTFGLGAVASIMAVAVFASPWIFRWLPHHRIDGAPKIGASAQITPSS